MTVAAILPGTPEAAARIAEVMAGADRVISRREMFEPVFPIVHLLRGVALAPPTEHVEGLLLNQDINLFAGHGGSLKSTLQLHVIVCVALGLPVFGTLAVRRQGNVLLVLPEDGQAWARMALEAIAAGMGLSEPQRALLADRVVMIAEDCSVDITKDARSLASTALDHEAVLVDLDPVRNLLGEADEQENNVAGRVCDELRREICRRAGATVILSHHLKKPGGDRGDDVSVSVHDIRGAGSWVNGSRLAFSVAKRGDRITLVGLKANRTASGTKHELDLAIEADTDNKAKWVSCKITDANGGATSDTLTAGRGRALNANEAAALACLDDRHEKGLALSWSRWCAESGLKADTFKSVRTRLLDARLAAAIPTGRTKRTGGAEYNYMIAPEGRTALATGWAVSCSKGETVSER